jgi:hypothetical protein
MAGAAAVDNGISCLLELLPSRGRRKQSVPPGLSKVQAACGLLEEWEGFAVASSVSVMIGMLT